MAVVNMDYLFDKLQEYIDTRIESTEFSLKELFDKYGVKIVAENIAQVVTVANSIVEVRLVAHNIGDVINCSDNMAYIKVAPEMAEEAIKAAKAATARKDEARYYKNQAHDWATEEEDVPVNDYMHPIGFSAYHWAQKASVFNPEDFYNVHGDVMEDDVDFGGYRGFDIGPAVNGDDVPQYQQVVAVTGDVMTGNLIIDGAYASVVGPSFINTLNEGGIHIQTRSGTHHVAIDLDHTTGAFDFKFNDDISFTAQPNLAPMTPYAPTEDEQLTRKDYVDTGLELKYDKTGGPITGNVDISGTLDVVGNIATDSILAIGVDGNGDSAVHFNHNNGDEGVFRYNNTAREFQINDLNGADQKVWHSGNFDATLHNHDDLYYRETEFLGVSAGVPDGGKPIVLNSQGVIDVSMLETSTFVPIGAWDPSAGTEYPDTTGVDFGSFWYVDEIVNPTGQLPTGEDYYEFATDPSTYDGVFPASLIGKQITVGDFMVWSSTGWGIMAGEMNPMLYYKLDGTNALTAPFAGGGEQLKNIAPGTEAGDAVEYSQISGLATSYLRLDGTTPMEAPLNGGGFSMINVANGAQDTDAVNLSQLNLKADITYVDSENAVQDTAIATAQSTADDAQTAIDTHEADLDNPHGVTTVQIGAEPDLGLGAKEQILATNIAGTGKEWIDVPISLPDATGKQFNELTTDGSAEDAAEWSPFRITPKSIAEDVTVVAGSNATVGSFTLEDTFSITVEDGASLIIV